MSTNKKDISCPQCGKKRSWTAENKFRPFCSERCKMIDLGEWASEKYKVPSDPTSPNSSSNNTNNDEDN